MSIKDVRRDREERTRGLASDLLGRFTAGSDDWRRSDYVGEYPFEPRIRWSGRAISQGETEILFADVAEVLAPTKGAPAPADRTVTVAMTDGSTAQLVVSGQNGRFLHVHDFHRFIRNARVIWSET